jgi:hypothetical protein
MWDLTRNMRCMTQTGLRIQQQQPTNQPTNKTKQNKTNKTDKQTTTTDRL